MNFRKIYLGNSYYSYVNLDLISEIGKLSEPKPGDKYVKYRLSRVNDLEGIYEIEALFPVEWEDKTVIKYIREGEI